MALSIRSLPPGDGDGWRAVLVQWGQLLDRYESLCREPRDVAYWYGELALTGLLTAAACQLPAGSGLVELPASRQEGEAGSTDAWIRTPGGFWYAVEAKVCWPTSSDAGVIHRITEECEQACRQLRNLHPEYRQDYRLDHGMALCYVVPYFRGATVDALDALAEQYQRAAPMHLVATYRCLGEPPEDGGKHYPGLVVVGRQVW